MQLTRPEQTVSGVWSWQRASWRWRAGAQRSSAVGGLGFEGRVSSSGSRERHVKERGLDDVDGGVSSTEFKSKSILSGLNLESSAWCQLVGGFEGNKVGDGDDFRGRQRQALVTDWTGSGGSGGFKGQG